MVISVASQKGRTGKTSTSISLAAGLAHNGKRVLLIDPKQPAVVREHLCEGYLLRSEGSVRLENYVDPLSLKKLSSRLSVQLEKFIGDAKLGWHELWQNSSLRYPSPDGGHRVMGFLERWGMELRLLSADDFADIAQELADEFSRVLDKEHRQVLFWFSPYSYGAAVSADHRLPPDVQARLDADTAWLVASRPSLGQERMLRWGTLPGNADSIPLDEQWPRVGCWQITAFPRTVAWLKKWIRDAQREIAVLQAQWDRSGRPVEERVHHLEQTYRKRVQRKQYMGSIPAKRLDPLSVSRGNWRGRHPPPPPIADQWYDQVDELDQTHADRRLELTNELVQLPPFTAYVRTASGQHHVALTPPVRTNIDEPFIEQIRQASKARFGRPPGSPKPSACPTTPKGPGGRPAGPRIGRHPDEE